MVSLDVSTNGLVPAYKYNMSSMVSLNVSTNGLVPAYKYNISSMVPYMLVLVAWFLRINISFRLGSKASNFQSSRM